MTRQTYRGILSNDRIAVMPNIKLPDYERFGSACPDKDFRASCKHHTGIVNVQYDVPALSTRYDLTYTYKVVPVWRDEYHDYSFPEDTTTLCTITWWQKSSGGTTLRFNHDMHLHNRWVAEKMGINERDADGILMFLEQIGHSVSFDNIEDAERQRQGLDILKAAIPVLVFEDDDYEPGQDCDEWGGPA